MNKKSLPLTGGDKDSVFALNRRQLIRGLMLSALTGPTLFENLAVGQEVTPFRDPPDEGVAWVCPMHPDYTSISPGVCPLCGMTLIQNKPYDVRNYRLVFYTEPAAVHPGEKVTLFFKFLAPGTGQVVKQYELVHTKLFHLFVISRDMEFFEHIHPTLHTDGTWTIDTVLPKPGYYAVFCDFMPKGGSGQFLTAPLVTANYTEDLVADSAHLVPDTVNKKVVGDITATISFTPPQLASCQYVYLNYYLTDTTTGHPIVDLQTYLGQFSHMMIMSEDMECYVHTHPENFLLAPPEDPTEIPEYIIPPDADLAKIRGGPKVIFDALMPKPGIFRAWAQFRRNNQMYTIPYTFNVPQGPVIPVLS